MLRVIPVKKSVGTMMDAEGVDEPIRSTLDVRGVE
jgi:hypothetical protein